MAHDKQRDAGFAGAHTSIGTVTVVDVPPSTANSSNLVVLRPDANHPDGTVLHRRLRMMGAGRLDRTPGALPAPHARLREPR